MDEQALQYFYKRAYVLVFPSTNEGFGLPITEVMNFGTPAIARINSSLVEVVGDAGLLENASNV